MFPACDAVSEHVPELTKARVVPVTVHTDVVVDDQLTVSDDDAVAEPFSDAVTDVHERFAKLDAVMV